VERKIIRLLIVDDSPDEAEIGAQALRKGGFMLKTQRAHDLPSMQAALESSRWDLIITEHTLPHFGAQAALELVKRASLDVPFIVLTRSIIDRDLITLMTLGAHDVILKNQTARIVPVVKRELRAADDRADYRQAQEKLKEMEGKHRAIVDGSREAICYVQDGMHIDANAAYLAIFGYDSFEELEGVPIMNLIDRKDQATFKDFMRKMTKDKSSGSQEFLGARKDGNQIFVEFALSAVTMNGEACTQIVVTDISKRKSVETKLQYLNQHDPLTGLYNRGYFLQEVAKAIDVAKKEGMTSGVIYLDLHELQQINSRYGHAAGDRLLLKVVRLLREKLSDDTVLARFAGDEFAVLLRGVKEARLHQVAAGIVKTIKDTQFTEGNERFTCQCACGTAVIDATTENAQKLIEDIYHQCEQRSVKPAVATEKPKPPVAPAPPATKTKAAPPKQVKTPPPARKEPVIRKEPVVEDEPVVEMVAESLTLAPAEPATRAPAAPSNALWQRRIQTALDKGQFTLVYQPVINLEGESKEYFEVLVRMLGDNGEMIAPGEFLPAAHQFGLTTAIDRWVVSNAIDALAVLSQEGRDTSFFINLCPSAFTDVDLMSIIMQRLKSTGVKPSSLIFEADESSVTGNVHGASMFINASRTLGCNFCLDNFGRDINVLSQLRDLPIQYLKIDGAIIQNLATDKVNQTSLKALIDVAKSLDKKTIAKCVEAADNLGVLWQLGVDYVQGHYFEQGEGDAGYGFANESAELSSEPGAPSWTSRTAS